MAAMKVIFMEFHPDDSVSLLWLVAGTCTLSDNTDWSTNILMFLSLLRAAYGDVPNGAVMLLMMSLMVSLCC